MTDQDSEQREREKGGRRHATEATDVWEETETEHNRRGDSEKAVV